MKNPKVSQFMMYGGYGMAAALAFYNVQISAQGIAGFEGAEIKALDWVLASGMFFYEYALVSTVTQAGLWPLLAGRTNELLSSLLKLENKLYQGASLTLMLASVAALIVGTWQCYKWDIATTQVVVYNLPYEEIAQGTEGKVTDMQRFKAYALVFGPEALMIGANLLGITNELNKMQFEGLLVKGGKGPKLG